MKLILLFLLILLLLIFYIFYIFNIYLKKDFSNDLSHPNCEIVISRFNENLEWINNLSINNYNITIYNKGQNNNFINHSNIKKVVNLQNVGRESHTYLYHIINNYDNLADITVFSPGSCDDIYKNIKIKRLINLINNHKKAIFIYDIDTKNIKDDLYDFSINNYSSTNKNNNNLNSEYKLEKADIHPYGKWYEKYFGNIIIEKLTYNGIFSVAKEDILQHPKIYYEELIKQLSNSSNPEVGHYFERSWAAIFHPMKNTMYFQCNLIIYYYLYIRHIFYKLLFKKY